MPRSVLIDEIHVHVHVPARMPAAEAKTMLGTLRSKAFMAGLRSAIRALLGQYPALAKVRCSLSR